MATTLGFWYFMFLPSEAVASFVASPPLPALAGIQRQKGFSSFLPLISRVALSGCRGIPFPSTSTRTKCTCCRSRAGGRHPVRTDIPSRKNSTRTNRNGLRRPCAHASSSARRGIRVRGNSIRNACICFPSFAPLFVVSRPDTVSVPPFTSILARRGKIFHPSTQKHRRVFAFWIFPDAMKRVLLVKWWIDAPAAQPGHGHHTDGNHPSAQRI